MWWQQSWKIGFEGLNLHAQRDEHWFEDGFKMLYDSLLRNTIQVLLTLLWQENHSLLQWKKPEQLSLCFVSLFISFWCSALTGMHSLITQTVHMCTKRPLVSTADYIITLLPPGTQQHEGRAAGWLALHCGHWKLHCAHCGGGGTDPRAGIQKQSSLYNTLIIKCHILLNSYYFTMF